MPEIVMLEYARANGLKRYFTGKPCKSGHVCERMIYGSQCVECNRANRKQWAIKNPDKVIAWNKAHPEKMREINNNFYANNKKSRKLAIKSYMAKRPDHYKKMKKKYRDENKDIIYANLRNRRARKKNAVGKHSGKDIIEIYNRQRAKCAYCQVDVLWSKKHIDHIVPLVRGGSNWPENLQITCAQCNLRKNSKTHEEFLCELALAA